MNKNIYNTFFDVVENLKQDENVKSIIHVGSSKEEIYKPDCKINDIDLFIIVENQDKNQIRKVEKINNIEFDFNYISIDGCNYFIENKEYFFLNIKDGKLLYDKNDLGKQILSLCRAKYKEGPKAISLDEKRFQACELLSNIDRLKNKEEYDEFEYDFLTYINLTKIIKMYFVINNIWLPKDKKLLKTLKIQEPALYKLICDTSELDKYKKLIKITDYVFINL